MPLPHACELSPGIHLNPSTAVPEKAVRAFHIILPAEAGQIMFSEAGVYVRGFDHEAPMSPYGNDGEPWPGVIDEVPEVFKPFVEEPAFTDEDDVPVVTACLWRETTDDRWRHGVIDFPAGCSDPDGATGLFEL